MNFLFSVNCLHHSGPNSAHQEHTVSRHLELLKLIRLRLLALRLHVRKHLVVERRQCETKTSASGTKLQNHHSTASTTPECRIRLTGCLSLHTFRPGSRPKVDCPFFFLTPFFRDKVSESCLLGSFHSACERQTQTPQHRILRKAMPLAELLKSRVRDEFACPIMPWVPQCSCTSRIPKQHSLDPPVRRQIRNMHRKLPAVAPSQVCQKFPNVHCSKSRTSTEENDQVLPDNRQVYRCYVYLANF